MTVSLLEDLKNAGRALDIQFQPSTNEVQSVVGALVHYLEHGDEFLKAVESGTEDVAKLLSPTPQEPAAGETQPADTTAPASPADSSLTDEELANQISDLQALQASRQATAAQTTVTHETDVAGSDPAAG